MSNPDNFNRKPLQPNAPLTPAPDESGEDLNKVPIDQTRKTAPQHTSRMPAPVMTKPKKKKKKKTVQTLNRRILSSNRAQNIPTFCSAYWFPQSVCPRYSSSAHALLWQER